MQTHAVEILTTFVDDAVALIRGFGRIVVQTIMRPIDRLAHACDVADVLGKRASSLEMGARPVLRATSNSRRSLASRRGRGRRSCIFSLASLGQLT